MLMFLVKFFLWFYVIFKFSKDLSGFTLSIFQHPPPPKF